MKKLISFSFGMMLCIASMNAQISLDTIVAPRLGIGYDFYTVQISTTETKYFLGDTLTNTFSLYNMDFTPFMTNIAVPEPFLSGFQVMYVTRTLFDCDSSNIEYVYASPTNNNKPYRIVRDNGTILFQLDSAVGPFCTGGCLGYSDIIVPIRNTSDGAKLLLNKYNSVSGFQNIYIYSLCDSLPTSIFDFKGFNQSFVSIFPNPNSGLLSFKINAPDNINDYELLILDGHSREIKRERINFRDAFTIDMSDCNSGTYYYSLCAKNKAYQSGKFILTK